MNVRFRPDVGWEMRCDDCRSKRAAMYWPLTHDYWNARNMTRCRACHRDRKNAYERASTSRKAYLARYREREREAIEINGRAYYDVNREALLAYNREYRAKNADRIRQKQRERYARLKENAA